jgi:hypothetical protein
MNPQELIITLKTQHRVLQTDLSFVTENLQSEKEVYSGNIVVFLEKFKMDLLEHLKLENDVFYPDFLNKKTQKGEDVTNTKIFIKDMDVIGTVVMAFLEDYNSPERISASIDEFKERMSVITDMLNTRIESEEEGVFGYYLLM